MKTAVQENIQVLLTRSIFDLCKNKLQYTNTFTVKGVLEISTDNSRAFFVDIQEEFDVCKAKQNESPVGIIKLEDGSFSESHSQREEKDGPTLPPAQHTNLSKSIESRKHLPCTDNVSDKNSLCTLSNLSCISTLQNTNRESYNDTEQCEFGDAQVKIEPPGVDSDGELDCNMRQTGHFNTSCQPGCSSWINRCVPEGLYQNTDEDLKPDVSREAGEQGEESIGHVHDVERRESCDGEILGVWSSQQSEDTSLTMFHTPSCELQENLTDETQTGHTSDANNSEASTKSRQLYEQKSRMDKREKVSLDSCKKNGEEDSNIPHPQHSGRLHYCDVCNKEFDRPSGLKKHRRVHTGERPYICKICDRAFSQNGTLKRHYNTHTREASYKCKTCDKSFAHLGSLTRHHLSHTGEKPYICEICGRRFSRKCLLQEHSRTHTGEKPYLCKICGKGFAHVYNLTVHRRTHSSEKAFRCGLCGQGFNHQCGLKRHLWKHTGEKPFVCKTCGKVFYQSSCLKRHLSIHTGVKLFVCKLCGKGFNQGSQLREHNLKHTDPMPYGCSICEEKFPSQKRLKKHQVKCHHN